MCERVHVACACECTLQVRDFFFEAHSPLRSAARETTLWVGPLRSQKLHNFLFAILEFLRAREHIPRNENDVHATKNRGKWVSKEQNPENEGNFRKIPKFRKIAKILEISGKIKKISKNDRFSFFF